MLAGALTACGGGDSAVISQKMLIAPKMGLVESYTPLPSLSNVQRIKALRVDAPQPSSSIVLDGSPFDRTLAKAGIAMPAPGKPPQIGIGRKVMALASPADFSQRLQWRTGVSGGRQAAIRFVSAGAVGTRLALAITRIDPRTLLRVYGRSATTATEVTGAEMIETIYRNLAEQPAEAASRVFYAPYVAGEEVTLELELPDGVPTDSLEINVPRLSHLYQSPESEPDLLKLAQAGSCQVDVACRSEWAPTGNATARLIFSDPVSGSTSACTGTLLNDRGSSGAPNLLTANHCISTQAAASSLQTFWFYRAASCGSSSLYAGARVVSGGATLLYASGKTDTSFLRLNNSPPAGVTYSGWTSSLTVPQTDIGGVHHPQGGVQKVNVGRVNSYAACQPLGSSDEFSCAYSFNPTGATHLNVGWSSGVLEPGSSGSGVFQLINGGRYLVGQLTGGSSSCSNPAGNDVFGRFDLAYQAALYKWLDQAGPPLTAIYRFYNAATGAHFFTANSAERDYVIATYAQFKYEGIAFYAYAATGAALSPVYRFYNTSTGAHFYTMSTAERDIVMTYPQFRFEGPAWYAQSVPDGVDSPLYRFYNASSGAHFYTMSAAERDSVMAGNPRFKFEGIAYYAWTAK